MPLGKEVELGPRHIVLAGDPASPKKGHNLPQFSAHVCCSRTAEWIKMPLGTELGLGPGNIVLDGGPSFQLPVKRGTVPTFQSMSVVAKRLDGTRCHLVGGRTRSTPHCVRWGPSSPPKGHSPQFSADICCGQTAGWIQMPLGTELGLGPGDCVRWGPGSTIKGTTLSFRRTSIVAKRHNGSRCHLVQW